MAAATNITNSRMGMTDRLMFKLAALFCGVFFALFFGFLVYDLFSSFAESRAAEAGIVTQPATIVIDPKMRDDLARVMAFDSAPGEENVRDPFYDRTGISGTVGLTRNATAQTAQTPSAGVAGSETSTAGSSGTRTGSAGSSGTTQNVPASQSTAARLKDWEDRRQLGEVIGPEWAIYNIEDLVPVGYTSGGAAPDEVALYSKSTCRTISVPVGTQFLDGWLNTLNTEFVVFIWNQGTRSVTKSFARPNVACKENVEPAVPAYPDPRAVGAAKNE